MPEVFAAVKALIERDGKFLALELEIGRKRIWDLPGGKVEYGEEPLQALEREAWEETGLKVAIKEPVGVYHFMRVSDAVQIVNTVFRCSAQGNPVLPHKENEKIAQLKWFSGEEFLKEEIEAPKSLKELIGKVLQ